jgi:hypothetical protein
MKLDAYIRLANAWQRRRKASGKLQLTADELWQLMQRKWPSLSAADRERIFQELDP